MFVVIKNNMFDLEEILYVKTDHSNSDGLHILKILFKNKLELDIYYEDKQELLEDFRSIKSKIIPETNKGNKSVFENVRGTAFNPNMIKSGLISEEELERLYGKRIDDATILSEIKEEEKIDTLIGMKDGDTNVPFTTSEENE